MYLCYSVLSTIACVSSDSAMVQLAIQDILANIYRIRYVMINCEYKQATGPVPRKLCI